MQKIDENLRYPSLNFDYDNEAKLVNTPRKEKNQNENDS